MPVQFCIQKDSGNGGDINMKLSHKIMTYDIYMKCM